jgi:4-methyl-5(b-hydroxyethyl)-thiazole monophosphate biosynthesis
VDSSLNPVLVLCSHGCEEIETVALVDILRRAQLDVVLASPSGGLVTGSRGIVLQSERRFAELSARDFSAVALPGGLKNARTLAVDPEAQRLIREARALDRVLAAICAAPLALKAADAIGGARFTSHPSIRAEFEGERYAEERVVVDGRLVTSRGPGTALEFALALVGELCGPERAAAVAAPLLLPPPA